MSISSEFFAHLSQYHVNIFHFYLKNKYTYLQRAGRQSVGIARKADANEEVRALLARAPVREFPEQGSSNSQTFAAPNSHEIRASGSPAVASHRIAIIQSTQ